MSFDGEMNKAEFASRSEAARYAASIRWKNSQGKKPAESGGKSISEAKSKKILVKIDRLEERIFLLQNAHPKTDKMRIALYERKRELAAAIWEWERLTGEKYEIPIRRPTQAETPSTAEPTSVATGSSGPLPDNVSAVAAYDSLSEKQLAALTTVGLKFRDIAKQDDMWKTVAVDNDGNEWFGTPYLFVRVDHIPFGKKPKFVSYEDANAKVATRMPPDQLKERRNQQIRQIMGIASKPGQVDVSFESRYTVSDPTDPADKERVVALASTGQRFVFKASDLAVLSGKPGSGVTFKFLQTGTYDHGTLIAYQGKKVIGLTMSYAKQDQGELAAISGSLGVSKASFASRSEAGRFAANQRWKGHGGSYPRSTSEMRSEIARIEAEIVRLKGRGRPMLSDSSLRGRSGMDMRDVNLLYHAEKDLQLAQHEFRDALRSENPLAPDTEVEPRHQSAAILASRVRYNAEMNEPEITALMIDLASENGGVLEELKHRLKTTGSLARKIFNEAQTEHGGDLEKAAAAISDSVRYTMVVEDDRYTETVKSVISRFEGQGFSIRAKNFWQPGDPFDSMTLKLTKNGVTTELQMLTPAAKAAKEKTHPHYEVYRDKDRTMATRFRAWDAMVRIAKATPRPAGLAALLAIGTLVVQKPDWAI